MGEEARVMARNQQIAQQMAQKAKEDENYYQQWHKNAYMLKEKEIEEKKKSKEMQKARMKDKETYRKSDFNDCELEGDDTHVPFDSAIGEKQQELCGVPAYQNLKQKLKTFDKNLSKEGNADKKGNHKLRQGKK